MKIRFLVLAIDTLAGTERAAVAQANALAGRHDVEIVSVLRSSKSGRVDVDRRVKVRYLAAEAHSRSSLNLGADRIKELRRRPSTLVPKQWDPTLNALCDVVLEDWLPTVEADVVVTMTTGLLVAAAQRLPSGVALVHQEHRSSMHRTAGREPLLVFGPRADALVSLTEVNASWLGDMLGAHAPPIYAIPNAAPSNEQPRSTLDRPLIVAAGRLAAEKQYAHLVRAFGQIADEIPTWRLRIFGNGPQRNSLAQLAANIGLYDRLELPGVSTDLGAEWVKASVSALTSKQEALPLVIQESLAAGVPVVSYDCPTGPGELIEHGVNGFLVPRGDIEGLAGHLLDLAVDAHKRHKMGAAAVASLDRYRVEQITARWEEIYTDAVSRRRSGPVPWTVRQARPVVHPRNADFASAPEVTPGECRRNLLSVAVAALGDTPGAFVLPARGDFSPTVVVPSDYREQVLQRLSSAPFPAHVSMSVGADDYWLTRRGAVDDLAAAMSQAQLDGLSLEPWPSAAQGVSHLAHGAGIRVEFWRRSRDGSLMAPLPNPYLSKVCAEDLTAGEVDGVAAPVVADLRGPFVDSCPFPIDVVYTWVDDRDPKWQEARRRAQGNSYEGSQRREASGDARFRNRDELRYSLRSIHAHADWVRTVYIVTAGQRPTWLADDPRVRVVDHRDLLPESALPTFNSQAIETALHKIDGLSEHFVYFNDDFFLGRPLPPSRFFSFAGSFAVFPSPQRLGVDHDEAPYIQSGLNNRRLLRARFGLENTHTLAHAPYPLSVSVLDRVCHEFPEVINQTAHSPFRASTDVSMASSLAQHVGVALGKAYLSEIDFAYMNITRPGVKRQLGGLLNREHETICLADSHDFALPEHEVAELVADFLESYFPVQAPWERR